MPHRRILAAAAVVSMIAAAAAAPAFAQAEAPAPPQATPNPVPMEVPAGDGTAVRLTTELGDVVIGLFNESAPVAAENFLNLAESGYYDGVGFHRVVPGFVVQGGDPEGTGRGGPGYGIQDEEVVGQYGRGIVAMARPPEAPNSQGSQFFFVLGDEDAQNFLEPIRTYAIFGRVVEGMDVVDAIVAARPPSDLIEDPVRILSASVEQVELPPEPTPPPPTAAQIAAANLEALLPRDIAGLDLQGNTFTSEEVLTGLADEELAVELGAIAAEFDAEIDEFSIATGGDDGGDVFVTIVAGSIPGVPGASIQDSMVKLLLGDTTGSEISQETIAERDVTVIRGAPDAGADSIVYVVPSGDVVWLVISDDASVEEAIAALP
jgi:cyclophilin family peptidyl-prolyl cis-trans isomerase